MREYGTDVVVVGSGGAGLLAACVAADAGLRVTVLERAQVFGGTTAISGGMLWVPGNHLMAGIGIHDSREDALRYLRAVAGLVDEWRLEQFVDVGPAMVRYLVDQTPAELFAIDRPDYHPEWPGAREGGRTLDNRPFDTSAHPNLAGRVREGSHFPPLTYEERHRWRWPELFDWESIAQRMVAGVRTLGGALAAALVAACDQRGVELFAGARAHDLVLEADRVLGVAAQTRDGSVVHRATAGVILASGGFEWNDQMKADFLRGPEVNPVSPPGNTGDGLVMGMAARGAVGNMSEAWWVPTFNVPGEFYDDRQMARHLVDELSLPGSILVNRHGRRFVNESTNYNDLTKTFHVFDPAGYEYVNLPAWLVFDAAFKRSYMVATVMPGDRAPDWFLHADTVEELAGAAGIDPVRLSATVAYFNQHAGEGQDPEFHRGHSRHDRYYGDGRRLPNPCLAPLEEPPFYAVPVTPGSLGTKGGLITDHGGRVLRFDRSPVPGLFACGNVAASVMGTGYPGAGGTLGPALTGGYLCGLTIKEA